MTGSASQSWRIYLRAFAGGFLDGWKRSHRDFTNLLTFKWKELFK